MSESPPRTARYSILFRKEWRAWLCLWKSGYLPGMGLAGLVISAVLAWTADKLWVDHILQAIHDHPERAGGWLMTSCRIINQAGDFCFTLGIVLALVLVQLARPSGFTKRLIVSVICSALLVTVAGRVTKAILGRVRPREMIRTRVPPWHFKGPNFDPHYDSFPSGHASFAASGSGPLLTAVPWAGIPLTLGTLAIGSSRAFGLYHHPSDVFGGTWLGLMIGCASGRRLRRIANRAARVRSFLPPTCPHERF